MLLSRAAAMQRCCKPRRNRILINTHSCFSTSLQHRHVRMEGSKIHRHHTRYPTPGDGHDFRMNIFGLLYSTSDIMALQDCVWTHKSFLPRAPARLLPNSGPYAILADVSDIASVMAVELKDGSPGLLAKNELRQTVAATLDDRHFQATMNLLQAFQNETDSLRKRELGQLISNVAFWSQWLIRGVLFEGKLHWQLFCESAVRAPLSKIAFSTNAALGRHQIEFVYDVFPDSVNLDKDVDYDDAKSIMDAVAAIDTLVGFRSIKGGSPEHNFRHIHSLMEYQMKRAFCGGEQILLGNVDGWNDVVEAARRANRVFQTMLRNTPPESYPQIRLPIKGVRGACGTVYHKHGVFYEGVGADEYVLEDGSRITGAYINNEWGQTGANSSMYKWFDLFCGVTQARQAYAADPISLSKMAAVFEGRMDSGQLGDNPIDSMQRAFDLFTRPPRHMKMLVDTEHRLRASGVLDVTKDPHILLQRLRLAYWVAQHRMTHGKYVLASIYQTVPVGGQSRAEGTGGSTPPFLKLFLDQTIQPARNFIIQLLMKKEKLNREELEEVMGYAREFDVFEATMEKVRMKGQQLEFDENVSNAHA
ncbi:hypothetical protein MPSEU_000552600 [Mayamaea pseudoterrestris]|nr:hypothetical protein MPSEU_000552600 [Mayamaea pseudoterrestris]